VSRALFAAAPADGLFRVDVAEESRAFEGTDVFTVKPRKNGQQLGQGMRPVGNIPNPVIVKVCQRAVVLELHNCS